MKRVVLVMFLGSCAYLGGSTAVTVGPRFRGPAAAQQQASGGLPAPTSDVLRLGDRFEAVARKVSPAVVYVEATKPAASGSGPNGKQKPIEESGSGMIIKYEG